MALDHDPAITHVGAVHCETTTGLFNPIRELGKVAAGRGKVFMVDAMSSFGAVPIPAADWDIDYLVSSSNKCIEGVPGFSFVLARRSALEQINGYARSLSLNLLAQWRGLEADGQFRFTPPTHAMLAFRQALAELEAEGGVAGRAERYRHNHETLIAGMRKLGFLEYLRPEDQGYIITSFRYPDHPNFDFNRFYEILNTKGFVIYPGKVSDAACFRIGTIGRIFSGDVLALLAAIRETLTEMEVTL
jgi:2-aminoethylphosphonate-pyruvate transaminase